MGLVLILKFSKLSLAIAIMVLKPVSCYYMTSFNYGAKKARDVGLTCRCHLSNIMPDSIFYESMGFFFFFFLKDDNHCLPQQERDRFSCPIIMPSVRYQLWSLSEDSRIVISLRYLLVRVCYVVLNQGCCKTCPYNLLHRMLPHDFNTALNQSYVNSHYFG